MITILHNSKRNKKGYVFRGSQIEIDLNEELFKRDTDSKWKKLPFPTLVIIKQEKAKQTEIKNAVGVVRKHQTYTVHIETDNKNILAYQGIRSHAVNEANRIAQFLDVEIKTVTPRNSYRNINDHDDLISSQ